MISVPHFICLGIYSTSGTAIIHFLLEIVARKGVFSKGLNIIMCRLSLSEVYVNRTFVKLRKSSVHYLSALTDEEAIRTPYFLLLNKLSFSFNAFNI